MASPQESLPSSSPPVNQFNVPLPSSFRTQMSSSEQGVSPGRTTVSAHLGFSQKNLMRDGILHAPPSQKLLNLERDSGSKDEAKLLRMHAAVQDLHESRFDLSLSAQRKPTEEALVETVVLRVRNSDTTGSRKADDTGIWDQFQVSLSWCDDHSTHYMKFTNAQELLAHIAESRPIPSPVALSDDWSLLAIMSDAFSERSVITVHDCTKSQEVSQIPVGGTVKTLNFAREAVMLIACGELELERQRWSILIFNTTTGVALRKFAPENFAGGGPFYELMGTFASDNERIYSIVAHPKGEHRVVVRRLDDGVILSPTEQIPARGTEVRELRDEQALFSSALFSALTLYAKQRRSATQSPKNAKSITHCFQDIKAFPHSQVLFAEDCYVSMRGKHVWRATLVLRDGTVLHLQNQHHRHYSLVDPYLYLAVKKKDSFTHQSARAQRVWPVSGLHELVEKKKFAGPRAELGADDGLLHAATSSVCAQGRILACVYHPLSKQGLGHRGVIALPQNILAENPTASNVIEGGFAAPARRVCVLLQCGVRC